MSWHEKQPSEQFARVELFYKVPFVEFEVFIILEVLKLGMQKPVVEFIVKLLVQTEQLLNY